MVISAQGSLDERVAEYQRVFLLFDTNGDGHLDEPEILNGLRALKLPSTAYVVKDLLGSCDTDNDGAVDLDEFVGFCERKRKELVDTFKEADANHDGHLSKTELHTAINLLGNKISSEQLDAIFNELDANHDGHIDWDEWQKALTYLPYNSDSFMLLFDQWQRHSAGNAHEDIVLPTETHSVTYSKTCTFAAGGIAGALSRTLTAPVDRVKVLRQLAGTGGNAMVDAAQKATLPQALKQIYKEGGVRGLFRGNFVNCLKIVPQSGVQFWVFESLRSAVPAPRKEAGTMATLGHRFFCGGTAGLIAQTCVYPLDTIKTRISAAPAGTYKGLVDCARHTIMNHGVRGLYRGYGATVIGVVPYAGVDLTIYETLKSLYKARASHPDPSPLVMLCCGTTSSTIGQIVTYPFAVARSRLQAQGGVPGMPAIYKGLFDCLSKVYKAEGAKGLYKGLSANLAKAAPAAGISYYMYEVSKRMLKDVL